MSIHGCGRYGITRNLLACGTCTSRVAHPSGRYKRSRRLNVEPFTMALPKAIMLRIQAAGHSSPDVESAGIFRANHLADAPRVVALVVLYRMATRNTAPG